MQAIRSRGTAARVSMGFKTTIRFTNGFYGYLDDSWAKAPDEARGQRNMDDEVLR